MATPFTETSCHSSLLCVVITAQQPSICKLRARQPEAAACWARFANIDLQPGAWQPWRLATLILSPLLCKRRSTQPMLSCPVPLPVGHHIIHSCINIHTAARGTLSSPHVSCHVRFCKSVGFGNCQPLKMTIMRAAFYELCRTPQYRTGPIPLVVLGGAATMMVPDRTELLNAYLATETTSVFKPRPVSPQSTNLKTRVRVASGSTTS